MEQIPMFESVIAFASRHPQLLAIVVATLAAWIVALMVERYWLDTTADPKVVRHQKFGTFLLNVFLAGVLTPLLWNALAPAATWDVMLPASLVVGIITAFIYPILARVATNRWPSIGTAWMPRE